MKMSTFITLLAFLPYWLVNFLWRIYIKGKGGQLLLPARPDVKELTPEQLIIEIGEHLGGKYVQFEDEKFIRLATNENIEFWKTRTMFVAFELVKRPPPEAKVMLMAGLAHPLDLDRSQELENKLTSNQKMDYVDKLNELQGGKWDAWNLIHADAETRGRAWVAVKREESHER